MKICVFDTETTSLEKPFCYNVGFLLADTETGEILHTEEFCIEQIWHNNALFASAYYADKRPFYVQQMRARKISLEKWGYVTQKMARLFKAYEIECAFAYNSSFDEKVFEFNCDWFKTINPFDNIPILDIRGYVHHFIAFDKTFQEFCEKHQRFTESGHYSTTAETVFQYLTKNPDFIEDHTALSDTIIEFNILQLCEMLGAKIGTEYKTYRSIPRKVEKTLTLTDRNKQEFTFTYESIRINKDKTAITLK